MPENDDPAVASVSSKALRGHSSQFFVAGELCRRGLVAVVTLGGCPNTDVLCSNTEGTLFVHIQVKTCTPHSRTCSVGLKAERDYGDRFFWVVVELPGRGDTGQNRYFVVPSKAMATQTVDEHQKWLKTPGVGGKKHNETSIRTVLMPAMRKAESPSDATTTWLSQYEGRWELIEGALE